MWTGFWGDARGSGSSLARLMHSEKEKRKDGKGRSTGIPAEKKNFQICNKEKKKKLEESKIVHGFCILLIY